MGNDFAKHIVHATPNAGCHEIWEPPRSELFNALTNDTTKGEAIQHLLNTSKTGQVPMTAIDAWNAFDGRDGMSGLVANQKEGVVEALKEIRGNEVNNTNESLLAWTFGSIDQHLLLKERGRLTEDGVHYHASELQGVESFNQFALQLFWGVSARDVWVTEN